MNSSVSRFRTGSNYSERSGFSMLNAWLNCIATS